MTCPMCQDTGVAYDKRGCPGICYCRIRRLLHGAEQKQEDNPDPYEPHDEGHRLNPRGLTEEGEQ